jgi:serine/threonine protein kinase
MYETLAGRVPFTGRSAMAVLRQHIDAPIPDLAESWPDAPPILCSVVRRCLEKTPDARYPSIPCLAADLIEQWPTPELIELAEIARGATIIGTPKSAARNARAVFSAASVTREAGATSPTILQPRRQEPSSLLSSAWKWVLAAGGAVLVLLAVLFFLRLHRKPQIPKGATPVFLRAKDGSIVRAAWESYDPSSLRMKFHLYRADGSWETKSFSVAEFAEKFGDIYPTTEVKLFAPDAAPPEIAPTPEIPAKKAE